MSKQIAAVTVGGVLVWTVLALGLWSVTCAAVAHAEAVVATNIGPFGGTIQSIAIDPTTPSILYASTWESGIFKSTDGTQSWMSLPNTGGHFNATVVIDPHTPSTIYVGHDNSVLKSTDSGLTWNLMDNFSASRGQPMWALAIDPTTPTTLYAGADSLFKSTDGGSSWNQIGLANTSVFSIVVDPSNSATFYAGTAKGVFKSPDAGGTGSLIGLGNIVVSALSIDPTDHNTLYAGTVAGVFQSTDAGMTWNALGLTANIASLAIDPLTASTLYAATGGGIYKSIDGAANWTEITALGASCLVIDPSAPAVVYAGATGAGVFKSPDAGATWTSMSSGMNAADVQSIAISAGTPAVMYAGLSEGVATSWDGGTTWNIGTDGVSLNSEFVNLAIDPASPSTVYAAADARGVLKSTDAGATWATMNVGLPFDSGVAFARVLAIDPLTPTTLYVGLTSTAGSPNQGVFKSTDGAATWTAKRLGSLHTLASLVIDPTSPNTLYLAAPYDSNGDSVFKSTDGGDSWTANSFPPTLDYPSSILALAIDPTNPNTLYAADGGQVFKSTDGAATWNPNLGYSMGTITTLAIDPNASNTIYGGGDALYISTDAGLHWGDLLSTSVIRVSELVIGPAIVPNLASPLYVAALGDGSASGASHVAALPRASRALAPALQASPKQVPGVIRIQRLPRAIAKPRSRTGCQVQWFVPDSSAPIDSLVCVDGDSRCDAKADQYGLCELTLVVCLNNSDPNLPMCTPAGISEIAAKDSNPAGIRNTTWQALFAADVAAHQHAIGHLLDPLNPDAGYVGAAPLRPTQQHFCSAPFAVDLPLGTSRRKTLTLSTRSADYSAPLRHAGISRLRLTCEAKPQS